MDKAMIRKIMRSSLDRLERSGLERLEHHHKPEIHSSMGVIGHKAADPTWLDKAIAETRHPAGEVPIGGRRWDKAWSDEVASLDPKKFEELFLTTARPVGSTLAAGSVTTEADASTYHKASSVEDAFAAMERFLAPKEDTPTMTKRTLEDLPWTVQQAVSEEHIDKLDAALASTSGLPELWAVALTGPCKLTVKTGSGYKVKSHIGGEEFVMIGAYIGSKKGPIIKLKPVSPAEYVYAEVPVADCMDLFSGDPMQKLQTVIAAASMGLPQPEPAKGTPEKLDARRVAAYEDFGSF